MAGAVDEDVGSARRRGRRTHSPRPRRTTSLFPEATCLSCSTRPSAPTAVDPGLSRPPARPGHGPGDRRRPRSEFAGAVTRTRTSTTTKVHLTPWRAGRNGYRRGGHRRTRSPGRQRRGRAEAACPQVSSPAGAPISSRQSIWRPGYGCVRCWSGRRCSRRFARRAAAPWRRCRRSHVTLLSTPASRASSPVTAAARMQASASAGYLGADADRRRARPSACDSIPCPGYHRQVAVPGLGGQQPLEHAQSVPQQPVIAPR